MKIVSFSLEQGNKYYGIIDGSRFYIGSRVSYQGGKGLQNLNGTAAQKYDRVGYRGRFGFWSDFIHPTAMAEGALYHTLNTYDRAKFTFSFLQFAAHVPNGDFIVYFRALLKLPLAKEYFPDLVLQNNRICKLTDNGLLPLESDTTTSLLMQFLNPTSEEVEDTEVINSAKFVHWAQNDPGHRNIQIEVGISIFKEKLANCAKRYNLGGADDTVCAVVADIRHQGRAKSAAIIAALASANPLEELLEIGESAYPQRIKTLRNEIQMLKNEKVFGVHKYDLEKRDFVKK